ncbi:MAG: hypothetical protein IPP66_19150 [Anaerolineales bacterium]|nr:hypothetical protein [Anaerolineales bacterium]
MNRYKFLIILAVLLTGCGGNAAAGDTTVSTGPYANAGPVTISATVDTNGEIKLGGSYQHRLVGNELLGAGWAISFETTLNDAKQKANTLYILYEDAQGNIRRLEYDIDQPFEINFENDQWVQKIARAGDGNIVVYVQTKAEPMIAVSSGPPIFERMDEYEQNISNQLEIHKDIYFSDPDGDAAMIEYEVLSISPDISGVYVQNDLIDAPTQQQQSGTSQKITWQCGSNNKAYTVKLRAHIVDQQGNKSSGFSVVFKCH